MRDVLVAGRDSGRRRNVEQAQLAPQYRNGTDNRRIAPILLQLVDKRPIDLELLQWQQTDVLHRRLALAEVVQLWTATSRAP